MRRIVILVIMFNGFKGQVGITSVGAKPYPQWGVEAAADAANAIDAERFQKIAAAIAAAQEENTAHDHNHQDHDHSSTDSFNNPSSSLVPTVIIEPNLAQQSATRKDTSRFVISDCDHPEHHHHFHKNLHKKNRRRGVRRQQQQQHQPQYPHHLQQQQQHYYKLQQNPQRNYYPSVSYPQQSYYNMPGQPLQNWGFWKWGQDNFSSVWSALFN